MTTAPAEFRIDPAVPPPVARLAVDPDQPTRLAVADALGDQLHVSLLLLRLHPPPASVVCSRIATSKPRRCCDVSWHPPGPSGASSDVYTHANPVWKGGFQAGLSVRGGWGGVPGAMRCSDVAKDGRGDGEQFGDSERRLIVEAELESLADGTPSPGIELTDGPVSAAHLGWPWRAPKLVTSRRSVDISSRQALRGEFAHEYAHILEPEPWLRHGVAVVVRDAGGVGASAWVVGVFAPFVLGHDPRWLAFWAGGIAFVCAALAVELLGDVAPVLAMLGGFQAKHERLSRLARTQALLSHPSPTRRRQELLNVSSRAENHRLASDAFDLSGHAHQVGDRGEELRGA